MGSFYVAVGTSDQLVSAHVHTHDSLVGSQGYIFDKIDTQATIGINTQPIGFNDKPTSH
jgi:hypothetical protein